MIEEYIRQIDQLLSTSEAVVGVQILRYTVRQTELERVLHYRYRVRMRDGAALDIVERVVEVQGVLDITKYRHHWQDAAGQLVKRWDNAPHYPQLVSFPHHLHQGPSNQVLEHAPINGLDTLRCILGSFADVS